MKKNMSLMQDFYKVSHQAKMYPENMKIMYSTWTPRSNKYYPMSDHVVWWGVQGFLKELVEDFNEHFFKIPLETIVEEYEFYIRNTFDKEASSEHIVKLHKLGYLPLKIKAIDEGTLVPMRVPCMTVTNTLEDFAWLVGTLETLFSCSLWMPTTTATTAYVYRNIISKHLGEEDQVWKRSLVGDFSFRGCASDEAAIRSGAAFLTSFTKTSTIPSIKYLKDYYGADPSKEEVGSWSASVEHSCTAMNYAIDGDEETFFKKLLVTYEGKPFSFVADTYDYFNFLDTVVRNNADLIKAHRGTVRIRPDSGDPETIICGMKSHEVSQGVLTLEDRGSLDILWEIFGGTVEESTGLKLLDSCIGLVYGDSITPERCEEICERMVKEGYSIKNCVFGCGSYSLQYKTRDSFGWAYKCTFAVVGDKEIQVFKNPKTSQDSGFSKTSQKGICRVYKDEDGELYCKDGFGVEGLKEDGNDQLKTIFVDGLFTRFQTLFEIRERLYKDRGGF